jgi:hypothetical protein
MLSRQSRVLLLILALLVIGIPIYLYAESTGLLQIITTSFAQNMLALAIIDSLSFIATVGSLIMIISTDNTKIIATNIIVLLISSTILSITLPVLINMLNEHLNKFFTDIMRKLIGI